LFHKKAVLEQTADTLIVSESQIFPIVNTVAVFPVRLAKRLTLCYVTYNSVIKATVITGHETGKKNVLIPSKPVIGLVYPFRVKRIVYNVT
jgi:hypothetical protein